MANFIFPLVITLEQNTPAGATCRRIYKREYGAWLIALLPHKKEATFDASLSESRNEHPSA